MINIKSQNEIDRPFNLLAWGHWFTFGNLFLCLAFSFFYITASPLPDSLFGWGFLAISWVSHFAFIAIACFILTIFPIVTLFPNKKHIRGISAIMASAFQMLLFLDVLSYRGLGYHLSTSSLSQLREVEDIYVASIGDAYWFLLLAVFVFILVYQFTLSNFTWKKIDKLQSISFKNTIAKTLVSLFFVSHLTHMLADATLNADIAKQSNLFPLSYPLTAKTLLAEYQLIDLKEYEESKLKRAFISAADFTSKSIKPVQCDINAAPNLNVVFVDTDDSENIRKWLATNNINYQTHHHFNLSRDLDTAVFNITTGLPGLYQSINSELPFDVNHYLESEKVTVEVHHGRYNLPTQFQNNATSRAYVFYDKNTDNVFYRTKVFLIGFAPIMQSETIVQPQNITASYLSEQLNCHQYVDANLIDKPISQLHTNSIFSNYDEGYFNVLYKDNSLLFHNGQLIENRAFSNNKELNSNLDLYVIESAISDITSRRVKVEP